MGAANLKNLESENIVALCDVDPELRGQNHRELSQGQVLHRLSQAARQAERPRRGDDRHARPHARGDRHGRDRAGKHVYCQKPLTHDVYEARMLAKAAGESKVVTQMGIQGHSGEGIRHDLRMDLGGPDRRGARGRRLVQPDLLPLGPRVLELEVVRASQGYAARAQGA